jgi:hypothetical protein
MTEPTETTQRPAPRRPLRRLIADSPLSAVIAAYLAGDALDGERRELRSALSHVDAELGSMPVANVRPRHVAAMLDDLSGAGLSPRREAAVIDALHAVFAFAMARGLLYEDPTSGRAVRARDFGPPRPSPPATATATATPTLTMLVLGARVALWTTWIVVVGFLILLIALFFQFG